MQNLHVTFLCLKMKNYYFLLIYFLVLNSLSKSSNLPKENKIVKTSIENVFLGDKVMVAMGTMSLI